ncbi:MAG TPA: hypothetical protein VK206_22225 [Anaerolineales bacterium]|nr:hypothetical protein [Anaerolineales bacterium]
MLRISKIYMLLCLLISVLFSSCSNTPLRSPSPTPPVVEEWFGMQISSDLWQAETFENTIYERGRVTHRLLTGCRAQILSEDPSSINNYVADWDASTLQHFYTAEMRLDLWRIQDKNGTLRDTYFELFDTTGSADQDLGPQYLRRLAYVLVETGDRPIECVDAVYALLSSIKPESFPDIGIAQG